MKTVNTYTSSPAMPKGTAGNGYAPADYSMDEGVLIISKA